MNSSCWCGNTELQAFSPEYLRCSRCETLVVARMPREEELLAGDDESGFYSREYFTGYQVRRLGLPPIDERSRSDFQDRCLRWLRTFLSYKLPPARTLEIGCSHGAFVALLRWAGFDAMGLELSPWVAEFASTTFGIPVLRGMIEEQSLPPESLDAVIMIDVLEHLPNPVRTMRHCLTLLKPDGVLLAQTPFYPEGKSFEEMQAGGHAFLKMLLPEQHLFLFSRSSVRRLLAEAGAMHVEFEPPVFEYDMCLVAGRCRPPRSDGNRISEALAGSPSGRMVLAMLDLDGRVEDLTARYAESEADRAARLEMAERNGRQAAELDSQCRTWHEQMRALAAELETERTANRAAIGKLRASIESLERERDHAAACIQRQANEIDELTGACERLREEVANSQVLIERQGRHIAGLEAAKARSETESVIYGEVHGRLRRSLVFRLMRRLGLWSWLDVPSPVVFQGGVAEPSRRSGQLKHVVVDLTPVLPGGENGGAKPLVLELIENLSRMAPHCRFTLLTSARSHEEMAFLDSSNTRRLCVNQTGSGATQPVAAAAAPFYRRALRWMPAFARTRVERVGRAVTVRIAPGVLRDLEADLLFSPFTAPFFYDPVVPFVSLVHDLQFFTYSQFFSQEELAERIRAFEQASRFAARMVTVSDYVRQTVLKHGRIEPERVTTIHTALVRRVEPPPARTLANVLASYDLTPGRFFLYPANFWPHKNHEMLLTAFGMHCNGSPDTDLKLVLTGAPGPRQAELRAAAATMGLGSRVLFPGYVPDDELAALLHSCLAVVFPSLYEGFGIPVLEAMALGKPVLCSNVASLPEVAGDAALLFDPRRPEEIAAAMARIAGDPELVAELAEKGRRRASTFGGPADMAAAYRRVFEAAAAGRCAYTGGIHGVYADGWCGERTVFTFAAGPRGRTLVIELSSPNWTPADSMWLTVLPPADWPLNVQTLVRGQRKRLELPLPAEDGFIELIYQPVVRPADIGLGGDTRFLGFQLHSSSIVSPDGGTEILKPEADAC